MNNPLNIVPVVDTRAMQQETKSLLTEVREMIVRVLDKLT